MGTPVAIVGLGAMGCPMGLRLVHAGFDVHGVDRDPGRTQQFLEAGGTVAPTISAAVRNTQALLLLVVNAEQAEDVLFGAAGAARDMAPGSVVLSCLTMAPESAAATGARLKQHGLRMVDAPVSGGVKRAAVGTLTIMASGPPEDIEAARPFLSPLGTIHEIGSRHGQASTVKLINQLLCGVHLAAAAEAIALAERAGVDPRAAHDVLRSCSGTSHMFADRVPMMLDPGERVTAAAAILLKDLALVDDLARSVDARTPLARGAHDLFAEAASGGLGALNDSEIIRLFRA
jgi:L-threonate 2-dehydrogenase